MPRISHCSCFVGPFWNPCDCLFDVLTGCLSYCVSSWLAWFVFHRLCIPLVGIWFQLLEHCFRCFVVGLRSSVVHHWTLLVLLCVHFCSWILLHVLLMVLCICQLVARLLSFRFLWTHCFLWQLLCFGVLHLLFLLVFRCGFLPVFLLFLGFNFPELSSLVFSFLFLLLCILGLQIQCGISLLHHWWCSSSFLCSCFLSSWISATSSIHSRHPIFPAPGTSIPSLFAFSSFAISSIRVAY